MKRLLTKLLLPALICMPVFAHAATAIFYQPQLRDRAVDAQAWPDIFAAARARGFDTLVVQWTRHDDAFSSGAERDWLTARLKEARATNLKLIVGLASDQDAFSRLQQPTDVLDSYFQKLNGKNRELARYWLDALGADAIDGWYLPLEIDDFRWRDRAPRSKLQNHLNRGTRQIRAVLDRPVYISAFFAGNMSPESYAQMLSDLTADNHLRLWVQDGAGTGKLNRAERALYLDAASRCENPAAHGVVYELFRQTGDDATFRAVPLPAGKMNVALGQRAPCNGDSVFFSLRYLPLSQHLLPR
ncbi:MAG: DUF4434 domain-containing protein [Burkholderiaceae bacterium]|nr:DUF4434 domain-containing protein [Burkholderiaceae bacterium]